MKFLFNLMVLLISSAVMFITFQPSIASESNQTQLKEIISMSKKAEKLAAEGTNKLDLNLLKESSQLVHQSETLIMALAQKDDFRDFDQLQVIGDQLNMSLDQVFRTAEAIFQTGTDQNIKEAASALLISSKELQQKIATLKSSLLEMTYIKAVKDLVNEDLKSLEN